MSIFWPPEHVYKKTPAIITAEQFCTAFFHVPVYWELNVMNHVCLHENPRNCRHRNVTLIVAVRKDEIIQSITRYTNCLTKSRAPIHAEEFLIKDKEILIDNSKITIYAQLQPCHHSGGSDADPLDTRSCTELLIKWYENILKPLNIKLTIRVSNLYKCTWKNESNDSDPLNKRFTNSTQQALLGLKLLLKSNIKITAMTDYSWRFLLDQVSTAVKIDEHQWSARKELDGKLQGFIDAVR